MSTLENDLRDLVNNQRFSDLRLQCADGALYAYSGILAARSTKLNQLLCEDSTEPSEAADVGAENVLVLADVQTDSMLVTLEFIYTSKLRPGSLTRDLIVEVYYCGKKFALGILQEMVLDYAMKQLQDEDANFAAELLSEAVQRKEELAGTKLFEFLCTYLGRMQIDRIHYESLTPDALKALLEVTMSMKNQYFASTEYSVVRYVILHSAFKEAEAAFVLFESQLPQDPPTSYGNIPIEPSPELYQLYQPVAEAVAQYVHALSMERIDGCVLVRLEGLHVIERTTLIKGFRHHAVYGTPLAAHRGAGKCFEWSEMDRGQHVTIDGTLISSTGSSSNWQNVRARDPIVGFGPHEWVVELEYGTSESFGIGVSAAADYNTGDFLGFDPNAWIFFSGGLVYSPKKCRNRYAKNVSKGDVIRVHLDMSRRTLAFSVNNVNYGIAFTELPDCLYPVISLKDASVRVYRV